MLRKWRQTQPPWLRKAGGRQVIIIYYLLMDIQSHQSLLPRPPLPRPGSQLETSPGAPRAAQELRVINILWYCYLLRAGLDPTSDFRLLLSLQYRQQRVVQIAKRGSRGGWGKTGGEKEDAGACWSGDFIPLFHTLSALTIGLSETRRWRNCPWKDGWRCQSQ